MEFRVGLDRYYGVNIAIKESAGVNQPEWNLEFFKQKLAGRKIWKALVTRTMKKN